MGIHDDTVQSVLAATLRLQRLRRHLRSGGSEGMDLVLEVQHDLDEATSRLRRLVFELHPPTLDREGVPAAMRLYLAETLDPEGIAWSVTTSGAEVEDHVTAVLVYRLFREAVLNCLRHAGATTVDVTVDVGDTDVVVTVTDDGVGFDPAEQSPARPGHLGLQGGRALSEGVGGGWEVDSAPGAGTRVRFRVPRAVA
jgi:two-component system, NarL family, sensor kinase